MWIQRVRQNFSLKRFQLGFPWFLQHEKKLRIIVFGSADHIDEWSGIPQDFLHFGLSCIHLLSPVTVWCKKPFFFTGKKSSSHVTKSRSISISFNWYNTQYPYSWIIPRICNKMPRKYTSVNTKVHYFKINKKNLYYYNYYYLKLQCIYYYTL